MGRRAKYLTHQEQKVAAVKRQLAYINRSRYACAVTYMSRIIELCTRSAQICKSPNTQAITTIQPLHAELIALALAPLPETSQQFLQGVRTATQVLYAHEEQWMTLPPYPPCNRDTSTPTEAGVTNALTNFIHGRIWKLEWDESQKRMISHSNMNIATLNHEAARHYRRANENWEELSAFIKATTDGAREMAVALVHLQWCARRVYYYYVLWASGLGVPHK